MPKLFPGATEWQRGSSKKRAIALKDAVAWLVQQAIDKEKITKVEMAMARRKWVLRSAIIWHRKHALTEAVLDRPRRSYENIFMFAKERSYFFDREALKDVVVEEDVWSISARPKNNVIDTAPYPDELVERCLALG